MCAQLQLACVCTRYAVAFAVCIIAYALVVCADRSIFPITRRNTVAHCFAGFDVFLVGCNGSAFPPRRCQCGLFFDSSLGSGWIRESDLSCFGLSSEMSGLPGGCDRSQLSVTVRLFTSTHARLPWCSPRSGLVPLSPQSGLREIPRNENHTTRQL